jgi:hypothetical protein
MKTVDGTDDALPRAGQMAAYHQSQRSHDGEEHERRSDREKAMRLWSVV